MIYSKANLEVFRVVPKSRIREQLLGVHLSPDGATVATDMQILLAVSPVDRNRISYPDLGEVPVSPEGETVLSQDVQQVLGMLPKGMKEMQFCAVTENGDRALSFTTTDLHRQQTVETRKTMRPFPNWEEALRIAGRQRRKLRIVLDRRRIVQLLTAIDAACGMKDPNPMVFVELGEAEDAIIFRAVNRDTGQNVVGMSTALTSRAGWPARSEWEASVLGRMPKRVPKRVSRRGGE